MGGFCTKQGKVEPICPHCRGNLRNVNAAEQGHNGWKCEFFEACNGSSKTGNGRWCWQCDLCDRQYCNHCYEKFGGIEFQYTWRDHQEVSLDKRLAQFGIQKNMAGRVGLCIRNSQGRELEISDFEILQPSKEQFPLLVKFSFDTMSAHKSTLPSALPGGFSEGDEIISMVEYEDTSNGHKIRIGDRGIVKGSCVWPCDDQAARVNIEFPSMKSVDLLPGSQFQKNPISMRQPRPSQPIHPPVLNLVPSVMETTLPIHAPALNHFVSARSEGSKRSDSAPREENNYDELLFSSIPHQGDDPAVCVSLFDEHPLDMAGKSLEIDRIRANLFEQCESLAGAVRKFSDRVSTDENCGEYVEKASDVFNSRSVILVQGRDAPPLVNDILQHTKSRLSFRALQVVLQCILTCSGRSLVTFLFAIFLAWKEVLKARSSKREHDLLRQCLGKMALDDARLFLRMCFYDWRSFCIGQNTGLCKKIIARERQLLEQSLKKLALDDCRSLLRLYLNDWHHVCSELGAHKRRLLEQCLGKNGAHRKRLLEQCLRMMMLDDRNALLRVCLHNWHYIRNESRVQACKNSAHGNRLLEKCLGKMVLDDRRSLLRVCLCDWQTVCRMEKSSRHAGRSPPSFLLSQLFLSACLQTNQAIFTAWFYATRSRPVQTCQENTVAELRTELAMERGVKLDAVMSGYERACSLEALKSEFAEQSRLLKEAQTCQARLLFEAEVDLEYQRTLASEQPEESFSLRLELAEVQNELVEYKRLEKTRLDEHLTSLKSELLLKAQKLDESTSSLQTLRDNESHLRCEVNDERRRVDEQRSLLASLTNMEKAIGKYRITPEAEPEPEKPELLHKTPEMFPNLQPELDESRALLEKARGDESLLRSELETFQQQSSLLVKARFHELELQSQIDDVHMRALLCEEQQNALLEKARANEVHLRSEICEERQRNESLTQQQCTSSLKTRVDESHLRSEIDDAYKRALSFEEQQKALLEKARGNEARLRSEIDEERKRALSFEEQQKALLGKARVNEARLRSEIDEERNPGRQHVSSLKARVDEAQLRSEIAVERRLVVSSEKQLERLRFELDIESARAISYEEENSSVKSLRSELAEARAANETHCRLELDEKHALWAQAKEALVCQERESSRLRAHNEHLQDRLASLEAQRSESQPESSQKTGVENSRVGDPTGLLQAKVGNPDASKKDTTRMLQTISEDPSNVRQVELYVDSSKGLPEKCWVSARTSGTHDRKAQSLTKLKLHPLRCPCPVAARQELKLHIRVSEICAETKLAVHPHRALYNVKLQLQEQKVAHTLSFLVRTAQKTNAANGDSVKYLQRHCVEDYFRCLLKSMIEDRAPDPVSFMISQLEALVSAEKDESIEQCAQVPVGFADIQIVRAESIPDDFCIDFSGLVRGQGSLGKLRSEPLRLPLRSEMRVPLEMRILRKIDEKELQLSRHQQLYDVPLCSAAILKVRTALHGPESKANSNVSATSAVQGEAQKYLKEQDAVSLAHELLNTLNRSQPDDPFRFLLEYLTQKRGNVAEQREGKAVRAATHHGETTKEVFLAVNFSIEAIQNAFLATGKDRNDMLAWSKGEVLDFISICFRQQGLSPPSQDDILTLYRKLDKDVDAPLDINECLEIMKELMPVSAPSTGPSVGA